MPSLLFLVGPMFVLVISLLWYLSFLEPIKVDETTLTSTNLAFKTHIGPYQQTGKVMDEVYESLKAANTNTTQGFGIYYDSPKEVAADKLRSIAGCILPAATKTPEGIKSAIIPAGQVVHAQIPYRHQAAIMAGVIRVYPELEKYRKQHNLPAAPIMEVYDIPNKVIHYYLLTGMDKHILAQLLSI